MAIVEGRMESLARTLPVVEQGPTMNLWAAYRHRLGEVLGELTSGSRREDKDVRVRQDIGDAADGRADGEVRVGGASR